MMSPPESGQQWHAVPEGWRSRAWARLARWARRQVTRPAPLRVAFLPTDVEVELCLFLVRVRRFAERRIVYRSGELARPPCPHDCVEICRHRTSLDGGACMYGHQPEELP